MVLPWHPRLARGPVEDGVHFHPFRYAPHAGLNVFGYAGALQADVQPPRVGLRRGAARARGRLAEGAPRGSRRVGATLLHGHWVIPSGAIAAAACRARCPLVVSLHGSDVYVAERSAVAGRVARRVFRRADWLTACSDDLRDARDRARRRRPIEPRPIPYGVDADRFRPTTRRARGCARRLGAGAGDLVLFTAGRFVRKKGFEYLDRRGRAPVARDGRRSASSSAAAGDLDAELRERARQPRRRPARWSSPACSPRTRWPTTSPPPTSRSCRRSATTRATSTACPTW